MPGCHNRRGDWLKRAEQDAIDLVEIQKEWEKRKKEEETEKRQRRLAKKKEESKEQRTQKK